MTQLPRLRPLHVDEWDDDALEALRQAFPAGVIDHIRMSGRAPNVLATMLHHPALAGPFTIYGNVLLRKPAIGHRNRELMILRVAWRTGAVYEWVHHVRLAEQYDINHDDIGAIAEDRACATWTALERDLVGATDEMLDSYQVSDDTWRRLGEQLSDEQLVEIPFVVGTYTCLAMAFNSWNLQVENGADLQGIPLPPRA
ncbi:alkylhydroperoxidase family enzyme [Mycolicibacterium sp. BK556]|uniref:carboxymuconolactone decarboxylase family protein n=1 Tax=Mycobacteriaceae TaxID=1762 RepID=UPI00105F32B7|nr:MULTISPECIES: carboxymuconolactone decarboxylase family protein [Mycobacteriaceae]MBB3602658.1 alkylhydroperoxidase family enzyme [Mycolicibacterium sp. BK556]MBB3632410.1 alkylhydroperoxidase family enzyme [Mycolicibacterium sp. BK607]MBB3750443.1 alkylhydroperoxidase family enzyme [Mycolicibacterium sp. BK634]